MEDTVSLIIGKREIAVKEYRHQRVVTFRDIDMVHERPSGTANKRFLDNQKHFKENLDYFELANNDLKIIKRLPDFGISSKASKIILITESGYLMLVKSFTDDLAWQVQRQLVNTYFRAKEMVENAKHKLQERRLNLQETKMKIDALREVNRTVKALCSKTTQSYKNDVAAKLMQSFGIDIPEEVFEATGIQCDMAVKEFVDNQCEKTGKVKIAELHEVYMKWCKAERVRPLTKVKFGKEVELLGFEKVHLGKQGRCWTGIQLKM